MSFVERIKVTIDVIADGANKSVKGFRTAVSEAEGATGKFKAGASSAFSTISQHAGQLALIGGAALVGFAVKGAAAFTDLAKASLDLSKAVGLSAEQASRWIAVADDSEVSAETLTSTLGKIPKSLDSGAWDKYGIATRDAGGNARSTNDIFLDSLDVLGQTTNATERAKIGNELFGKGYAALAPMVGATRAEYEAMLGAVSDGQVMTQEEIKKAEKLRLAQDNLADAFGDVQIALGEIVAAGAPLLNTLADIGEGIADVISIATGGDAKSMSEPVKAFHESIKDLGNSDEDIAKLLNAFDDLRVSTGNARSSADKTSRSFDIFFGELVSNGALAADKVDNVKGAFTALGAESPSDLSAVIGVMQQLVDSAAGGNEKAIEFTESWGITQEVLDGLKTTMAETAAETTKAGDAADNASEDVQTLSDSYSELLDAFSDADVWDNVKDQFDGIASKGQEAWDKAAAGAPDAEKAARDYEAQLRNTKAEVIKYADSVGGIPPEKITAILAEIDKGDIAEAERLFDELKQPITKNVNVNVKGAGQFSIVANSKYATGTSAASGGPTLLGEEGPEIVNLERGDTVANAARTRVALQGAGGATYIDKRTTNVYLPSQTPETLAAALDKYNRRLGQ